MQSLTKLSSRTLGLTALRSPNILAPLHPAYISSSTPLASPDSQMQGKDQVQAEQQAKDPKKMANLGAEENKKRDDPHQTSGDVSTPGVKGKSRTDETIGRNVSNKASG